MSESAYYAAPGQQFRVPQLLVYLYMLLDMTRCRRVPAEAYSQFVRLMVIVCVDLVLRRKSDGKVLLVKRGTEPMKGFWWW